MPLDVLAWLTKVEHATFNDDKSPSLKREQTREALSTPKIPLEMSSPKKRKMVQDHGDGYAHLDEQTPRTKPRLLRFDTESHSSIQTGSGLSSASPRKCLADMNILDRRVEMRDFSNIDSQPPGLMQIKSQLERISRGQGILGTSSRESLYATDQAHLHPHLDAIADMPDYYFSDKRDELGSTPSLEDILYIHACAAECSESGQSEAGWNAEVHHPLLALALRPRSPQALKQLVNFMSCSTATLIKEYKAPNAPDKKIDYCVYVNPKYSSEIPEMPSLIDTIRLNLPLFSINPTGEVPLLCRPIAVQIETKRPGEGWDDAALQASTWLSAHLELLQVMIAHGKTVQEAGVDGDEGPPTLDNIGFIPGLIIQGHDWNFIAASRQGPQTIVWTKINK